MKRDLPRWCGLLLWMVLFFALEKLDQTVQAAAAASYNMALAALLPLGMALVLAVMLLVWQRLAGPDKGTAGMWYLASGTVCLLLLVLRMAAVPPALAALYAFCGVYLLLCAFLRRG